MSFFESYFGTVNQHLESIDTSQLLAVVTQLQAVKERDGKVLIAGNGGSAAMASHVAVDLTKVADVRALTFNEADLITCFANDFGYENWVMQALMAYADPKDLVILISSSGSSPNIVNAAQYAKEQGLALATFSGFAADNPLRQLGDENLWVDSTSYNIVEMVHHVWLLAITDYLVS